MLVGLSCKICTGRFVSPCSRYGSIITSHVGRFVLPLNSYGSKTSVLPGLCCNEGDMAA